MENNKIEQIICYRCGGQTRNHQILAENKINLEEAEYNDCDTYSRDLHHQIIKCMGCGDIKYRKAEIKSWNNYDDEERVWLYDSKIESEEIYPTYLDKIQDVPENINAIFIETFAAYQYGQNILCAGGIRAIIEAICKDKGMDEELKEYPTKKGATELRKPRSLPEKIELLWEKGYITESSKDTLHKKLKVLGDQALHGLVKFPKEELAIAINIIKQTLENIYTLAELSKKLPDRSGRV